MHLFSILFSKFRILLAAVALLCPLSIAFANESGLTIKAFLLPETRACPPAGYGQNGCERWAAGDAERIWSSSPVFSKFNIPPGSSIELGSLRDTLVNYVRFACSDDIPCSQVPANRTSVVLLFEWDEPQSGDIAFTRLQNDEIDKYEAKGRMENELRWVNHQRAEYFLPRYQFSWELSLGEDRWLLHAQ